MNSSLIYTALLFFSLIQLRLLWNEHLELLTYKVPIGWYHFHTYGSMTVYMSMAVFSASTLYNTLVASATPVWNMSVPFQKPKPSGGGYPKKHTQLFNRLRKMKQSRIS